MHKNKIEFISFLQQFTTIEMVQEHAYGLQLDFTHKDQVKSIFFHDILPNTICDLKTRNNHWIIWEDLWITKKDILQASIQAFFGHNKTIHGRKTHVTTVNTPTARQFLSENHLFSASTGKYRLGLYFENDLVGLMTFSAGRNWKEKQGKSYEINRFCNHKNYRVHGGFSKLLKAFIDLKNPVQLMTYADASWYHSTMYEQFGFKNKHQNKLSQFWISAQDFQRKLSLSDEDDEQNWMKVVNYESYKFTWES